MKQILAKLEDGTVLTEPARMVHRHSWPWATGGHASGFVTEVNHGAILQVLASVDDASHNKEAAIGPLAEFMGAIAKARVTQGWQLLSMDATSATLVRDVIQVARQLQKASASGSAEMTAMVLAKLHDAQTNESDDERADRQAFVLRLPAPLHHFFKAEAKRLNISLHQHLINILAARVYQNTMSEAGPTDNGLP